MAYSYCGQALESSTGANVSVRNREAIITLPAFPWDTCGRYTGPYYDNGSLCTPYGHIGRDFSALPAMLVFKELAGS